MSKTNRETRLLGYVDYSKECFCDALYMLKGYFGIVESDPIIADHFQRMIDYLCEEMERECDTTGVDVVDIAVAYFAKS